MSSGIIESGLSPRALDLHRALASLQEELEAIDFYQQRVDASQGGTLKRVLAHNGDDEWEHAVLALEWLRRTQPELDFQLRKVLYSTGDIAAPADPEPGRAGAEGRGLGLGALRKERP